MLKYNFLHNVILYQTCFHTQWLNTIWGILDFTPTPSPSFLLAHAIFEPNLLPYGYPNNSKFSHSTPTCLWRWNRQSVPKRRHMKFRRQGNTQKKNIQQDLGLLECGTASPGWRFKRFKRNVASSDSGSSSPAFWSSLTLNMKMLRSF